MIDRHYLLSVRERVRDADEQRLAGGPDRLAEDHGGHLLSADHGGSAYGVDLTPEHGRSVSLGAARRVENSISKLLREDPNTSVYLSREMQYVGRADRGSIFWSTGDGTVSSTCNKSASRTTSRMRRQQGPEASLIEFCI